MTTQLTFTNKSEYLNFRNEWKKTYAELTVNQRLAKSIRKESDRNYESVRNSDLRLSEQFDLFRIHEAKIETVYKNKKLARDMLDELAKAKKLAKSQVESRLKNNK